MDSLHKRADQADDLLKKLVERVQALEKNKSAGVVGVGIHTEVKQKIRSEIVSLRTELQKAHDENKALKAENSKLKKSAKAGGAGASSEYKKKNDANWDKAMAKAQNLRKHVSGLEEENKALKAEIASLKSSSGGQSMIKTDKLTQEQLDWLKNAMHKVRADMVQYMEKGGNASESAKPVAAAASGREQMTLETIQDLKYYWVTEDLDQLRKEREECELGELDDDDLKIYLGRKVRVIEIEEDDDSANVRFDSHDTQWFPVTCLYKEVAVAAAPKKEAAPAASTGSQMVQMTFEQIQERKMYFVTTSLDALKKDWYAAELGELDDEDFEKYLGREVKALDCDSDDETVNTRFDNHDTQHFPATCLYKKVEGAAAPAAKPVAKPAMERMSLETMVERKQYFVTEDLAELKKYWYEADLGELDDEDFMIYLGREVKAIDTEEDDETINVRFDNHDTQWFPVQVLFRKSTGAAAAPKSVNGNLKKQNMDTIKERKTYFVTKDLVELKKEWYEAELGELDDDDFNKYLGREVKTIDIEEDDETVNVRFDNHDSQWFPVTSLYQ